MPSTPFTHLRSPYIVIPSANIDTDQIIPARFLKTTERAGLGKLAFYDWRYARDGSLAPDFVLNAPASFDAQVLVAGRNFGCGSSREHAVWALLGAGFRAVVSSEFADIFRGNALGNGLLPVQVDAMVVAALVDAARECESAPAGPPLSVDLESQTLTLPWGDRVTFPIAPFAKHCLLQGIDEFDFLLGAAHELATYEIARVSAMDAVIDTTAAGQP